MDSSEKVKDDRYSAKKHLRIRARKPNIDFLRRPVKFSLVVQISLQKFGAFRKNQ